MPGGMAGAGGADDISDNDRAGDNVQGMKGCVAAGALEVRVVLNARRMGGR